MNSTVLKKFGGSYDISHYIWSFEYIFLTYCLGCPLFDS